ncbi:uncharacterized protein CCR75_000121 [Bremia lactucae]|uniref:Uncharacterized protein n=1 Tax=Bremia lactucae TaxID=4779 RepID=A0A976IHP4_BRELC|nr:hypothetical protein CCR75_000121 [Bremia lactucae]
MEIRELRIDNLKCVAQVCEYHTLDLNFDSEWFDGHRDVPEDHEDEIGEPSKIFLGGDHCLELSSRTL